MNRRAEIIEALKAEHDDARTEAHRLFTLAQAQESLGLFAQADWWLARMMEATEAIQALCLHAEIESHRSKSEPHAEICVECKKIHWYGFAKA